MGSNSQIKKNWFMIESLVSRDFKLKYRRSVLGVAWSVLNPLMMMLVLTAVFSTFFRFDIENYPVYLILGNTLFAFITGSSAAAMTSIMGSASLIEKVKVEKIVFPLEKILFELINFSISLIAVAIVMFFLQVQITWNILLLPVLLVYATVFSLGLGLLLSALAVFFRDLIHIWGIITTAWTYVTPLFYPVSILPEWMMTFEYLNPMYYFVNYFREIALWGTTPGITENLICLGFALVMLGIGLLVFRKLQSKFIFYI